MLLCILLNLATLRNLSIKTGALSILSEPRLFKLGIMEFPAVRAHQLPKCIRDLAEQLGCLKLLVEDLFAQLIVVAVVVLKRHEPSTGLVIVIADPDGIVELTVGEPFMPMSAVENLRAHVHSPGKLRDLRHLHLSANIACRKTRMFTARQQIHAEVEARLRRP